MDHKKKKTSKKTLMKPIKLRMYMLYMHTNYLSTPAMFESGVRQHLWFRRCFWRCQGLNHGGSFTRWSSGRTSGDSQWILQWHSVDENCWWRKLPSSVLNLRYFRKLPVILIPRFVVLQNETLRDSTPWLQSHAGGEQKSPEKGHWSSVDDQG